MAEIINVELEQEVELQTSYELSGGIIPTGTINITTNGIHDVSSYDVSSYADANVNVQGGITPTGTKQVTIDSSGTTTEDVSAYANVEITVPQGQYKPNIDATPTTPSITVSNGGLITAEVPTQYVNDLLKESFTEGYIESSDVSMKVKIGGSATRQMNTVNGQTVTPSQSQQNIAVQGDFVLGAINVAPIPSEYVIPTGTKQITENGTGIDVKAYEFVDVSVSSEFTGDDYLARMKSTANLKITTQFDFDTVSFMKINADTVCLWNATGGSWYGNQFAFYSAKTKTLVIPRVSRISDSMAYNSSIVTLDLSSVTRIEAQAFRGSAGLNTLIIRNTSVPNLVNVNAFVGTSFASSGSGGTLYVPNALISTYQSTTNWSTILGYANNSIQAIEGSAYENAYADGTPIS